MSAGRDLLLLASGGVMGLGLHEAAHLGWKEFVSWRKGRDQWFRPQKPSDACPGPAPAQHPALRPIKGQRASEGRHRPKQSQARFAGRVRRRVVPQPTRVAGRTVEVSAGQADGD